MMQGELLKALPEEHHRRRGDTESHAHMRTSNGVRAKVAVLWVWGSAVAAAGFMLLAWAMHQNYAAIERRIDDQKAGLHNVVDTVQQHDRTLAVIEANQKNIIDTQRRMEEKLDILLRRTN